MRQSAFTTVLAVGATLSLLLASCSSTSSEDRKELHRKRGVAYYEKGQFQEAAIEFKNLLQFDPKDPDGRYRLALTYLQLGGLSNLKWAFAELSETTKLDPSNADARLKLGAMYLHGGKPLKATEQADEILASAPEDVSGLVLRGQSLVTQKDYENGITDLKKAVELDPTSINIRIDLARAYVLMKDFTGAEAALHEALTVDPRSSEARLELADFFAQTGHADKAEAEYKRVLDMAPDLQVGYTKLAGFYQSQGRYSDAERMYQQLVVRYDMEGPQIHLGDYYTYVGQIEKARAAYQRAAALNPRSVAARNKLLDCDLNAGKLDEAEARIARILEKNPLDVVGQMYDARARLARGKTQEAIDVLHRLVLDAPQSANGHYYYGLALLAKGDLSQARRELTEAVKLSPVMYEARTRLAAVHLAEGSPDLAIREAKAAIRLNPLRAQPFFVLGDAYLTKKDLTKAKDVYEALTKATQQPVVHHKLGLIARTEKREADALAHFEQALAADRDFVDALAEIVQIKLGQHRPGEAGDRVAKQIAVSPTNPSLYTLKGQVLTQMRDFDGAEAAFKRAIGLAPNETEAHLQLAQLYHLQRKVEQAVQEYEGILAKNPNLAPVQMLLGTLYDQEKEYDKAKMRYEEALKLDPKFWQAANNLAYLLAERGGAHDLDLALRYIERAHKISPRDPRIADTMGWIYFKLERYEKALGPLKEAAENLATDPSVRYHYGLALLKTGDRGNAKKNLKAALQLSETFPGAEEAKRRLKVL
jgi:tetratricopeptide (TPR) repeat protein